MYFFGICFILYFIKLSSGRGLSPQTCFNSFFLVHDLQPFAGKQVRDFNFLKNFQTFLFVF